jgi:SpoVK/Ycf46/Vps4 family AAA+-type ATPase
MVRNVSDFVGSALGKSEELTRGILEQAKGCVLVIDEAYGLYSSTGSGNEPYREAVINTLVEQVQGVPGEDRAVILLGYKEEMETMLTKCNPGLSRRFQLENAFLFEDYDDAALVRILKYAAKKEGLDVGIDVATFAVKMLAKARAGPHFGNAGAVNNLLSDAKLRMQKRIKAAKISGDRSLRDILIKEDFTPSGYTEEVVSADNLLNGLVGCDSIRDKLEEYRGLVEYYRANGKDPTSALSFNYIFTGSPGCGKTTVARLMGKMFQSLGLIPCDEVVEKSASDLMTGYVGQTGKKTRDIFTDARGKVLFIDEAYQLNPQQGGGFMQEAVDEIVKCLTHEDYKNKMVVILAGYEADIDKMLDVNQGLRSRFTERIQFEDFTVGRIEEMLRSKLAFTSDGNDHLSSIAQQLKALRGFANGRDVETFEKKTEIAVAKRIRTNPDPNVTAGDLDHAMEDMIKLKGKPATTSNLNTNATTSQLPPMQYASSYVSAPPPPVPAITYEPAFVEEIDEEEEPSVKGPADSEQRFLSILQAELDRKGLNSQEGVDHLSRLSRDSHEFRALARGMARELDLSEQELEDLLLKWQGDQAKVREELKKQQEEVEKAKAQGRKALVPIWRCGVCGRADQPYIACYVAPYIVRYEERQLK